MKRILVPINHDAASIPAVECAARIAAPFGAMVDLINVREPGKGPPDVEVRLDEARGILDAAGVEHSFITADGKVGVQLARVAEMADVVVMRNEAHRRSGDGDVEVASTTLDLLRRTPRPVIAVTSQVTDMRQPIFAYNGSPQSRRAIKTALTMLTPEVIQRGGPGGHHVR